MQKWAIIAGEKISIVDDLLATGGTAMAAVELVEFLGWDIHSCSFVISLDDVFLRSWEKRQKLAQYSLSSVVSYEA
jgi:adenine phosphoribosyltransferase